MSQIQILRINSITSHWGGGGFHRKEIVLGIGAVAIGVENKKKMFLSSIYQNIFIYSTHSQCEHRTCNSNIIANMI